MREGILYVMLMVLSLVTSRTVASSAHAQDPCNGDYAIVFSYLVPKDDDLWFVCLQSGDEPQRFSGKFDTLSPNNQLTATVDYLANPPQLRIDAFPTSQLILNLPWQPTWLSGGLFWVGDNQLAIPVVEQGTGSYEGDLVLVHLPNFVENTRIDVSPPIPVYESYEVFSHDPTLNYYVYAANAGGSPNLVLVRRSDSRILWQTPIDVVRPPYSYYPVWSNDGSRFLYAGWSEQVSNVAEIYVVDNAGREWQLTSFANSISQSNLLAAPTWSPDDKFIAFWNANTRDFMRVDEENGFRLATLEFDTGAVAEFDVFHSNIGTFDIAWSPDSRFVAAISVTDDYSQQLTVTDVESRETYTVAEDIAEIKFWATQLPFSD